MSIKFLEGGCIFSFDNFGPEFIFPPPEHDYIMEGKIYGSPTGPVPAEKVIADPNILNDIESDASIIAYNKEDNSLLLIRDAVGATPLFYARTDEGCNASFNLSLLLKTLKKPPKHNEDAFYDFLATHYRYVFRESFRTFHHGVYQVPAGHYILIQENDVITNQYLDLAFDTNAQKMSFDDASHEYIRILDENVGLRLSALPDKSFAFTVSSGLDSSTVASLAARRLKTPLDTFTMSYSSAKGTPYDETPGVRALLASTDWKLNNLEMDAPLLLEEASELMKLVETPIVTVTWLANFHLARLARNAGYSYLFSGLGGDESLAGEFEHFFLFFADLKASGQKELLDRETEAWARLHSTPEFPKGPEVRDAYFERNLNLENGQIRVDQPRYTQFRHYIDPEWIEEMEKRIPPPPMNTPYPFFLSNRLFQEMTHETSPPTLWSEALSSNAGGIKGIFPMASPRLFRLALSLPGTFKYENGYTKMLIRRGTKGILPDSSRLNPVKVGFNAPLDMWLRDEGTAQATLDLLLNSPLKDCGWFLKGALEKIVSEHKSGEKNNMMLLWPLIQSALFFNL